MVRDPYRKYYYANIFYWRFIAYIVIMLLGYFSGRRETFSEDQPAHLINWY